MRRHAIMTEKTFFSLLTTLVLTIAALADAEALEKIPRIGFLSGSGTPANHAISERAFRQGLKDLGYVEGKNILFEVRYAEAKRDRIPGLVAELVQRKVDLLAT